jgi:hypothetical protein
MADVDAEAIRLQLEARVAIRVRWSLDGVPLMFDFSRALQSLRRLEPSDIGGPLEEGWSALLLFGEYDYSDGGGASGYLGVHEDTGEVYGLDVERSSSPMFFFNSDVDRFIRTFVDVERRQGRL